MGSNDVSERDRSALSMIERAAAKNGLLSSVSGLGAMGGGGRGFDLLVLSSCGDCWFAGTTGVVRTLLITSARTLFVADVAELVLIVVKGASDLLCIGVRLVVERAAVRPASFDLRIRMKQENISKYRTISTLSSARTC